VERTLPPIQMVNFLSTGAIILILTLSGVRFVSSFSNLYWNPSNIVVPPERVMLW
jgi:hypothetical protein